MAAVQFFSIGEIAQSAGIESSTIRYYEQIGLLPQPQRVKGQRIYEVDVLKRIALIQAAKSVGFTMAEIGKLLSMWQTEGQLPKDWREFVERKLTQVEAVIAQAETMRQTLRAALACDCWEDYKITLDAFIASADLDHLKSHTT